MTTRLPIDEAARTRLREAQKAEVTALTRVQIADTARARARTALDSAESALAAAKVALVRTSGASRAALLLNEPVKELQRVARESGVKPPSLT